MASSSDNNSHDSTAKAGWEITPYLSLCGAKNFDSPVQEGTQSCDGLEKGIVLAPKPLSVNLPENVARPQPQPVIVQEQKTKTRRGRCLTKAKFYFHPTCKRMFRSLAEVINFIRSNNTITSNAKETNAQELQGPQQLKLPEASINRNDKKRKNNTSIAGSESKKRRIFPVSWRTGMKTKDQSGVKEFFDDAYANLMNFPPSTPEAAIIEEDKKLSVEAFLLDAHENLLKGFRKEETIIRIHPPATAGPSRYQNGTSPEEIDAEAMNSELSQHALQNLEPSSKTHEGAGNIIPESPLQQGGIGNANADNKEATMNRWTDKEMEVVEIFSQGLGSDGNMNNQQDEEDRMDYSHFLFEPIPPGLF